MSVGRFALRKLYADLLSEDGTALIVYLAWLEAYGLRSGYGAVERYTLGGGRHLVRAVRVPSSPAGPRPAPEIEMDLPDGRFRLAYTDRIGPWTPAGPPVDRALRWSVVVPMARATARWPDGREVRGVGYADWVELDRTPRGVGLSRVRWGRIHRDGECGVFASIELRGGRRWDRTARWRAGGSPLESRECGLSESGDGDGILAVRLAGTTEVLHPERVLHRGDALDRDRIPGSLLRGVSRMVVGGAVETRWLSQGALYEDVRFS